MDSPILHDEKQLLQQIAQWDEAAFSTLFYAYLGFLQPFIRRLTKQAVDTEEIIQETFLRLWMSRDRLEEVRSLDAWIYTIAVNECYKWLKKQSSRQQNLAAIDGIADVSVLDGLHLKEVKRLIAEAVNELPASRRRIYQLSRDQGMKIPEIAALLGISPNTVKNTLVASLRSIRKYLALRGHEL